MEIGAYIHGDWSVYSWRLERIFMEIGAYINRDWSVY